MHRLFGSFDLFPIAQDFGRRAFHLGVNRCSIARGARGSFAEDVRVPANELAIEMVEYIGNREMPVIGGHFGIEEHLQQQVTELFGKVWKVASLDCIKDLIGLFESVLPDGVEGLFLVPWAAAGGAKARHDGGRLLKQR